MNFNKKIVSMLCILFVTSIAFFTVSCSDTTPKITSSDATSLTQEISHLGEGSNSFSLTVVSEDGKETVFDISTNQKTVGEALMGLGLISGEDGPFGLYVKTVNSVTYDFDTDGKYWAFYVNGEYSTDGVDTTDIIPGNTYMFKVE